LIIKQFIVSITILIEKTYLNAFTFTILNKNYSLIDCWVINLFLKYCICFWDLWQCYQFEWMEKL